MRRTWRCFGLRRAGPLRKRIIAGIGLLRCGLTTSWISEQVSNFHRWRCLCLLLLVDRLLLLRYCCLFGSRRPYCLNESGSTINQYRVWHWWVVKHKILMSNKLKTLRPIKGLKKIWRIGRWGWLRRIGFWFWRWRWFMCPFSFITWEWVLVKITVPLWVLRRLLSRLIKHEKHTQ